MKLEKMVCFFEGWIGEYCMLNQGCYLNHSLLGVNIWGDNVENMAQWHELH